MPSIKEQEQTTITIEPVKKKKKKINFRKHSVQSFFITCRRFIRDVYGSFHGERLALPVVSLSWNGPFRLGLANFLDQKT